MIEMPPLPLLLIGFGVAYFLGIPVIVVILLLFLSSVPMYAAAVSSAEPYPAIFWGSMSAQFFLIGYLAGAVYRGVA